MARGPGERSGEAQAAVSCLGLGFWHGERRTDGVDLGDHR